MGLKTGNHLLGRNNPVLASAAIDRLFEGSEAIIFKGKSYRVDGLKRALKLKIGM
jgi:DNA replication protein DnaC